MPFKTIEIDFGAERVPIEVPENAVIAEFQDPEPLASPARALADALASPHGAPPLAELAKPGMKVAIGFDDPTRPPHPWHVILPEVVELLLARGVARDDIVFICANGNHKKWSEAELRAFVGEEIFSGFWRSGQIVNHDCVDPSGLKHLGETPSGCVVEHNRRFVEADLMIYVGQVMAHTWGGYTGTGAVIGMASTRSILSHHNHGVVNHPRTATGDHRRMYFRGLKAEINAHIERVTGRRIFYVNWVGGSAGRMAGIFAGYSPEVEPPAWEAADRFSVIEVPQADVLVIGLCERFAYGSADNPLIAAIGVGYPPRVWLGDHVLRRGGVVIGMTRSSGEIDPRTYPLVPGGDRPVRRPPRHPRAGPPPRRRRVTARVSRILCERRRVPPHPPLLAAVRVRLRPEPGGGGDHGRHAESGRVSKARHAPRAIVRGCLEAGRNGRRAESGDGGGTDVLEQAHLQVRGGRSGSDSVIGENRRVPACFESSRPPRRQWIPACAGMMEPALEASFSRKPESIESIRN